MCGTGSCTRGDSCCGTRRETSAPAASKSPAPAKSLNDKLAAFDTRAESALDWVIGFVQEHRDEVLTLARARHVTGHYVYGDGRMYEYDRGRLVKEILEEVADAVVYASARLSL